MDRRSIEMILNNFDGLVVIDEAYINFSRQKSFVADLNEYPNLVVMQTLSKAWGLAGLRMGMAFASKEIIQYMNKVKPPYNISEPVRELALKALDEIGQVNDMIKAIIEMRTALERELIEIKTVEKIYPSDANFLLVKFQDAKAVYQYLLDREIVVRDRSNVQRCEDCLRITVGTEKENKVLIESLKSFKVS
jgi:histidinol-phosphate aminotransferase